jgi:myosin heavy subunit
MSNFKQPPAKEAFDISWITKDTRCWIYLPNGNDSDIYIKGIIKGIVPLSINKANSRVTGVAENGSTFEAKAHQLERCRDSNSIERDLIEMDIINAPEVLMQLKRKLAEQKIHTCLWNSLIIVNPFKLIPDQYS